MKKSGISWYLCSAAMAMMAVPVQAAPFSGATTDPTKTYIQVGTSNYPGYPVFVPGKAGFSVFTSGHGVMFDFNGFSQGIPADASGVHVLGSPVVVSGGGPTPHYGSGVFNFSRVGTGDVWFGEWSENGNMTSSYYSTPYTNRTAFYIGDNADTDVVTGLARLGGLVEYQMSGMNKYGANDLLTGTFTADFDILELYGSLSNASMTLELGTAYINSNASVTGHSAYVVGTSATGGILRAQFFNGHQDLAGIIRFTDSNYSDYSTSFGGSAQ